jgi:hypothetical protein
LCVRRSGKTGLQHQRYDADVAPRALMQGQSQVAGSRITALESPSRLGRRIAARAKSAQRRLLNEAKQS